jgi:RNA polymerase sigma factor (sigma-70 family)
VVELAYALSGNRAGAEDIAQEAFLRAHRDWQRVGRYQHPGAWVRRVAANLATSALRRRLIEARALARVWAREEPALAELPVSGADFWRAVRSLPRRQDQAVALHYLEDLPVADIARVLGCAEGVDPVRGLRDPGRVERRRSRAQVAVAFALLAALVAAGLLARRWDPPATGPLPSLVTVAVGRDAVWSGGDRRGVAQVARIDPATNRVVAVIDTGGRPVHIAADGRWVWVAYPLDTLVKRIGPRTNRVVGSLRVVQPQGVAVGFGSVWVPSQRGREVLRLDPRADLRSLRDVGRVPVPGEPAFVAVGPEAVWVGTTDRAVHRIDPATGRVTGSWPTGRALHGMAVDGRSLWTVDSVADTVSRARLPG